MKSTHYLIRIAILLVLFVVFLKPEIFPLSQPVVTAIKTQLRENFGMIAGGRQSIFTRANVFTAGAVIVLMRLIGTVFSFIFSLFSKGKAR